MANEVSFTFSFQNLFLSMKMKAKNFQIKHSWSAFHFSGFRMAEARWVEIRGTDLTVGLYQLPAGLFPGQLPICLRHLEGLFLQVGWPIISSGHKSTLH